MVNYCVLRMILTKNEASFFLLRNQTTFGVKDAGVLQLPKCWYVMS